jgi:uncharacterized protein YndB with AHSA1/START domain
MKKTLHFETVIRAPRQAVWKAMLERPTYEQWTTAFCEGSSYEGSWDTGATIRFTAPGGMGMVSEIAEHRPAEFVSIRHLGEIREGNDDTSSEKVRAWAPCYENYTFTDEAGGTRVTVDLDSLPGFDDYMQDTFPKALQRLKDLCEAGAAR